MPTSNVERMAQLKLRIKRKKDFENRVPIITVQFPIPQSQGERLGKEADIIRLGYEYGLTWLGGLGESIRSPGEKHYAFESYRNIPFGFQYHDVVDLDIQLELDQKADAFAKAITQKYPSGEVLTSRGSLGTYDVLFGEQVYLSEAPEGIVRMPFKSKKKQKKSGRLTRYTPQPLTSLRGVKKPRR